MCWGDRAQVKELRAENEKLRKQIEILERRIVVGNQQCRDLERRLKIEKA